MGICDASRLTAESLAAQFDTLLRSARDRTVRRLLPSGGTVGMCNAREPARCFRPLCLTTYPPLRAGKDCSAAQAGRLRAGVPPDSDRAPPGAPSLWPGRHSRCSNGRLASRKLSQLASFALVVALLPVAAARERERWRCPLTGVGGGRGAAQGRRKAAGGEPQAPPGLQRVTPAAGGARSPHPRPPPQGIAGARPCGWCSCRRSPPLTQLHSA